MTLDNNLSVNADKVIQNLITQVSQLSLQIAILQTMNEELRVKIEESGGES